MIKKWIVIILLYLVQAAAIASCRGLILQQNDALKTAAEVFPMEKAIFTVVVCKESGPALYEVLYTQMHDRNKHLHNAPSGGLSKLKLPVEPNGRSRSTGIVLGDPEGENNYTLKLRTRFASGEALDISKTVSLAEGQSTIFSEHGISIGFSRLPVK